MTFHYRDYRDDNRGKTMDLPVNEFLRRFLLHVVPSRFVRIRYYGFLANRVRRRSLEHARELLNARPPAPLAPVVDITLPVCPKCQQGHMMVTATVEPLPRKPEAIDTS